MFHSPGSNSVRDEYYNAITYFSMLATPIPLQPMHCVSGLVLDRSSTIEAFIYN
jgi:hypothetical protein